MHAADWISLVSAVFSGVSALVAVLSASRAKRSQDAAGTSQAVAEQQSRRATRAAEESVTAQRRSADAATTSATIAAAKEERSKYGWAVTLHPNGDHYVLRNVGTLAARDVKLNNPDEGALRARFLMHRGEEGPVIQPGEAKAFYAPSTFSHPSVELLIDWLPEGERERRAFNEALPPTSNASFDDHVKKSEAARAAAELAAERANAETRRLLIELADAWGTYQDDQSAANKIRVQGIVGALPGNYAKEIGYAVDVPRDHWGPGQWPLEDMVQDPEDKKLVRDNAPMIELIWNLWQLRLPALTDADLSQPAHYWYRVEHAVYGYIDLVRRRQTGDRELIDGPRDRKHHAQAKAMLAQLSPPGTPNPPTAGTPGQSE